jgi:SAM-dependent methyltransferase
VNCCTSSQCQALDEIFDTKYAEGDLKAYRKNGPAKTTRALLQALQAQGDVRGRSLIDIGGGIGAIQLELLKAGLERSTAVDASAAFLAAARSEAERNGFGDRTTYQHGNFVEHADGIAPADIVTLDRVICCYPDMHALVRRSAERARHVYALVSPRDSWWMHAAKHGLNAWERLQRSGFRFFVHPDFEVEAILAERGMTRRFHKTMGVWQVNVWALDQ